MLSYRITAFDKNIYVDAYRKIVHNNTSVLVYVAHISEEYGVNEAANLMHFHYGYFHSTFNNDVYRTADATTANDERDDAWKRATSISHMFFIYNGDASKIAKCSESKSRKMLAIEDAA